MVLPIRTTLDDVRKVCGYLATKPTGATTAEAARVLDSKYLDGRKLSALKRWGLVGQDGDRMKLAELGRRLVKNPADGAQQVCRDVLRAVAPYANVLERAAHQREPSLTTQDVAAYWHEYFKDEVGDTDKTLNDQAVCFFQLVAGAALGKLVVGRHGASTRVDLDLSAVGALVGALPHDETVEDVSTATDTDDGSAAAATTSTASAAQSIVGASQVSDPRGAIDKRRVFITHGKNLKIVDQLKEITKFGKLDPVVALEHETTSKPLSDKVMGDMRSCFASVIHVAADRVLFDSTGAEVKMLNENVLIEIGASMALYGKNFILLVEDGVRLPSNLAGLYECRYSGDRLDGDATMKLLRAFNEFA